MLFILIQPGLSLGFTTIPFGPGGVPCRGPGRPSPTPFGRGSQPRHPPRLGVQTQGSRLRRPRRSAPHSPRLLRLPSSLPREGHLILVLRVRPHTHSRVHRAADCFPSQGSQAPGKGHVTDPGVTDPGSCPPVGGQDRTPRLDLLPAHSGGYAEVILERSPPGLRRCAGAQAASLPPVPCV